MKTSMEIPNAQNRGVSALSSQTMLFTNQRVTMIDTNMTYLGVNRPEALRWTLKHRINFSIKER